MSTNQPVARERFADFPLLRGVDGQMYARIAQRTAGKSNPWDGLRECVFAAGETILREGDYCDGAYYINSGTVEMIFDAGAVVTTTPRTSALARLRRRWRGKRADRASTPLSVALPEAPVALRRGEGVVLEAGEIFGEDSALSRYPLATTIVAAADSTCLLIRSHLLRVLFDEQSFSTFKATFDQRYRDRTLRAHLRRLPLFADLPTDLVEALVRDAELVRYEPGERIAEEGAAVDSLYLVRGGYVKTTTRFGAGEVVASYLRRGDMAGESGLVLGERWPMTMTALEHVELVRISRALLERVLTVRPRHEAMLWSSLTTRLKERASATTHPMDEARARLLINPDLMHGKSVFLIDLERCTHCDECVRACADAHGGVPRFVREGDRFRNFSVPTACYHCTDPVCMLECPTGAITRPLGSFEVAIDSATCIGCTRCAENCVWGNIQMLPYTPPGSDRRAKVASKCDLCIDRQDGPACVQMCPQDAAIRVNFKDDAAIESLLRR